MQDVIPLIVKQQINTERKEIKEAREVGLQDREPTIQQRTEKVSDLKTKSPNSRGNNPSRGLQSIITPNLSGQPRGKRRGWFGSGVGRDDLEEGDEKGDVFAEEANEGGFFFLRGLGAKELEHDREDDQAFLQSFGSVL